MPRPRGTEDWLSSRGSPATCPDGRTRFRDPGARAAPGSQPSVDGIATMKIPSQIRFLFRVGVVVSVVVAAKVLVHTLNFEPIQLNALFTGIIAANVFLMGFLLSGVLSDFKESERLPGSREKASVIG